MIILELVIEKINWFFWSYVLIILLVSSGLYFTFRTKFVQFRMLPEMLRLIGKSNRKNEKGVSSFQAFCISAASRVGIGNLAGVAIAITTGGPGAIFWMWMIALIGAASGFIEATLAQIYKVKDGESYRGGPAYYMEQALQKRWLGVCFAILISITYGIAFNSVQANTLTNAFYGSFGVDKGIMGIIVAIGVAIVIFGSVQLIAKVSEVVVPIMAGAYLLVAFIVVMMNITKLPETLLLIFQSAFGLKEAAGGALGAAIMNGIKRGLFSNEAGMGSAPNAAATAEVSHPVEQGLLQAFGVFLDTIIICSATAFVILMSGSYNSAETDGILLTQQALSNTLGPWAGTFVTCLVFLFAFTSIIGNYYYGQTNIEFIKGKNSKVYLNIYRIIVVGVVIFGSTASLELVWSLADVFMALMACLNLLVILKLGKIAFAALEDYRLQRKQGYDPVFRFSSIKDKGMIEPAHWQDKDEDKYEEKIS